MTSFFVVASMFAGVSANEAQFLGHGECVDSNNGKYERFTTNDNPELYVDNVKECECTECAILCEANSRECIGWDFRCCLNDGQKCIVEANVLFSKGTRPEIPAPVFAKLADHHWSTTGYYGAPTAGEDFPGEGFVANVQAHRFTDSTSSWCWAITPSDTSVSLSKAATLGGGCEYLKDAGCCALSDVNCYSSKCPVPSGSFIESCHTVQPYGAWRDGKSQQPECSVDPSDCTLLAACPRSYGSQPVWHDNLVDLNTCSKFENIDGDLKCTEAKAVVVELPGGSMTTVPNGKFLFKAMAQTV